MLLFERALTIITVTTTNITTIAVIETVMHEAMVMVLVMTSLTMAGAMLFEVVVVTTAVVHTVDDIDPEDPENILSFFAFECTQETPQSI